MATSQQLMNARAALGLSAYELGALLDLGGDNKAQGDYVRELESGARAISGPIWRVVQALLAGWRPGIPNVAMQDLKALAQALTGLQAESERALTAGKALMLLEPDEAWKHCGEAAGLSRAVTVVSAALARIMPDA